MLLTWTIMSVTKTVKLYRDYFIISYFQIKYLWEIALSYNGGFCEDFEGDLRTISIFMKYQYIPYIHNPVCIVFI